jgi:two-component system, OmpR family, sensor histidine kinase BaeS
MTARVSGVLVAVVGLAVLVLVVSEVVMASSGVARSSLYTVFAGSMFAAAVIGWGLTRVHRRLPSLRWTILVVAIAAVVVASAVVAASTNAMLLAPPELRLVMAALLLGAGLGVILAVSVAGPLTADLRRLAGAAQQVADGDLGVRTRIVRNDEVGELARSLDRMVEQLAELEDQRARGEVARRRLVTSIGHDLRTPLASLQAAIEALEDGVAPDPRRYLRSMGSDVELLGSMVDGLFVLARLDAGELPLDRLPIDLGELVDGAAEAVAPLAAKHDVEVAARLHGAVPVVADTQALDRVLRNLLDNAIRHAPAGSTVEVTVTATGGLANVRVHDDGPGFPPEFVDRAFDRFSRADEARQRRGGGAGLGLAIAKRLIEAHDGVIHIERGPGATVTCSLPTDERAVRGSATPVAGRPRTAATQRTRMPTQDAPGAR